jgi:MATE family multidrug resistance protein
MMGQLGQMLIGAGDVYIASRFSTDSVAAIGIANGVINPVFLFGVGLTMGISPSLSILRGAKRNSHQSLFTVTVYGLICGLCMTLLSLIINQFVPYMGFDQTILPSIQKYIAIVSWSFPFALAFQAIREYLQSKENVFIPNLFSIIAVVVNLFLNYILVFGYGSFQGLGEIGLALASVSIRIILYFCILFYAFDKTTSFSFSKKLTLQIFKFSLPVAFMFFLEVLAFCTVTILSGTIGVVDAASNNIIMTIASLAFMIPLSISSAVAVKVGHAYGGKNFKHIKLYSLASMVVTSIFILISASSFFLFPDAIMNFMSKDSAVIAHGVNLLFIVAIFQISDGMQVVIAGILRGLKFTKVPFIMILISYWIIGIPFGYYLAFYQDQGVMGLWIGLAISLSLCAAFLGLFTKVKLSRVDFNFI